MLTPVNLTSCGYFVSVETQGRDVTMRIQLKIGAGKDMFGADLEKIREIKTALMN